MTPFAEDVQSNVIGSVTQGFMKQKDLHQSEGRLIVRTKTLCVQLNSHCQTKITNLILHVIIHEQDAESEITMNHLKTK